MSVEDLAREAREHADNAFADIANAMTRAEHIRISRLAIEADRLANRLETLAGI